MESVVTEADKVGRKKRNVPARVVKLDADLVGTAEMLAKRQGLTTADYLSRLLRPILDKQWAAMVRKASEEGGEDRPH